jgi:hypothetical protein
VTAFSSSSSSSVFRNHPARVCDDCLKNTSSDEKESSKDGDEETQELDDDEELQIYCGDATANLEEATEVKEEDNFETSA